MNKEIIIKCHPRNLVEFASQIQSLKFIKNTQDELMVADFITIGISCKTAEDMAEVDELILKFNSDARQRCTERCKVDPEYAQQATIGDAIYPKPLNQEVDVK